MVDMTKVKFPVQINDMQEIRKVLILGRWRYALYHDGKKIAILNEDDVIVVLESIKRGGG